MQNLVDLCKRYVSNEPSAFLAKIDVETTENGPSRNITQVFCFAIVPAKLMVLGERILKLSYLRVK